MASIDSALADTLALVNVVRNAFGADALNELPSARTGQASDCVFARALRGIGVESVGGDGSMRFEDSRKAATAAALWGVEAHESHVTPPAQFSKVIGEFDSRRLTDLIS